MRAVLHGRLAGDGGSLVRRPFTEVCDVGKGIGWDCFEIVN